MNVITGLTIFEDGCELRFHLDRGICMYFASNEAATICPKIEEHINETIDTVEENKDIF